jgi:competence protein ComEC
VGAISVYFEADRWPLWLPVVLGTGAACYFALPVEPGLAIGWLAVLAGLAAIALAALGPARVIASLLAALLLGFGLAKLREARVATPVLNQAMVAHLTGRIVSIEPRERGARLVLDEIRSGAFAPGQTPRRIRVTVPNGAEFRPGNWLSLTAGLDAPSAPVAPGASDFGRWLYFHSIGATGFSYGRARAIAPAHEPGWWEGVSQGVEDLRVRMTARIHAALPGSMGGIAASLITGTRGSIAAEDDAALRDAGLAHALSISGLHMALVGGGIFWLVRALLAAIPALALRYPIKKWAAVAALLASAFYLAISGAAPPAVRAFVMLATMMTAVLLDRPALTMRSLALAAAILLLARPEVVIDAGFQMSFAAVAALLAVAEWEQSRERQNPRGMLYRYAHGIVMTSLVASLATAPFTLFYFERAAHYAVLSNLIAMPVMGFWIMPAAAVSVLLMPFGLERLPLELMGQGIGVMVDMGRWVSGLPGSVSLVSAMPLAALVLMALGGLWLAIWRKHWRWWGAAPMLIGVILAFLAPRPDMLVASDAVTIAVRGDDGLLHFVRKPRNSFVAREWLKRDGDSRDLAQAIGMPGLRCDGLGCVVNRPPVIAAGVRPEALAEDCARAVVVINAAIGPCNGPVVVIDQKMAADGQGWSITLLSPPSATSVRAWRGMRPWVADTSAK